MNHLDKLQLNLGWCEAFAKRERWAGARDALLRAAAVIDQMQAAAGGMSRGDEIDSQMIRETVEPQLPTYIPEAMR